jgi:hypothetical protein
MAARRIGDCVNQAEMADRAAQLKGIRHVAADQAAAANDADFHARDARVR